MTDTEEMLMTATQEEPEMAKMKITRLTKEQVILIPSLVKEGLSNREIGLRFNVTKATIDKWIIKLKTAGYKFPYRSGAKAIKLEKVKDNTTF